jgi:hypothetical protein
VEKQREQNRILISRKWKRELENGKGKMEIGSDLRESFFAVSFRFVVLRGWKEKADPSLRSG